MNLTNFKSALANTWTISVKARGKFKTRKQDVADPFNAFGAPRSTAATVDEEDTHGIPRKKRWKFKSNNSKPLNPKQLRGDRNLAQPDRLGDATATKRKAYNYPVNGKQIGITYEHGGVGSGKFVGFHWKHGWHPTKFKSHKEAEHALRRMRHTASYMRPKRGRRR